MRLNRCRLFATWLFIIGHTLFFLCSDVCATPSKMQASTFVCSEKRLFSEVSRVDFFYQNVTIFPHDQHVEVLDFSSNDAALALVPFLYAQQNRFVRETLIAPFFKLRERLDATFEKLLASTEKTEECTFRCVFKEKQKSVFVRFVYQKEKRKNDTSGFTIRAEAFVFGAELCLFPRTLNLLRSSVLDATVWERWRRTCGWSLAGTALLGGALHVLSRSSFGLPLLEPDYDEVEEQEDEIPRLCEPSARRAARQDSGVQCGAQTEDEETQCEAAGLTDCGVQCDECTFPRLENVVLRESPFVERFLPHFVENIFPDKEKHRYTIVVEEHWKRVEFAQKQASREFAWMDSFEVSLNHPHGFVVSMTSSEGIVAFARFLQRLYGATRLCSPQVARKIRFSLQPRICVIPLGVLRMDALAEAIPLVNLFRCTVVFIDDGCKATGIKDSLFSQSDLQKFSNLASWIVVDRFKALGRDGWDDRLFLIKDEVKGECTGSQGFVSRMARLARRGASMFFRDLFEGGWAQPKFCYAPEVFLGRNRRDVDVVNQSTLGAFFASGEVRRVLRQQMIFERRTLSLKNPDTRSPSHGYGYGYECKFFCSGSWQLEGLENGFIEGGSASVFLYVWYDDIESLEILRQKKLRVSIVLLYDGAGPLSERNQQALMCGLGSCSILRVGF